MNGRTVSEGVERYRSRGSGASLERWLERLGESVGRLITAFRSGLGRGSRLAQAASARGVTDGSAAALAASADCIPVRSSIPVASDPELHPPLDWYRDPVGTGVAG